MAIPAKNGVREIVPALGETMTLILDPEGRPLGRLDGATGSRDRRAPSRPRSWLTARSALVRREAQKSLLSATRPPRPVTRIDLGAPGASPTAMVVDRAERTTLRRHQRMVALLSFESPRRRRCAAEAGTRERRASATVVELLIGDRSLLVGQATGA